MAGVKLMEVLNLNKLSIGKIEETRLLSVNSIIKTINEILIMANVEIFIEKVNISFDAKEVT